jgi:hypothetical protein
MSEKESPTGSAKKKSVSLHINEETRRGVYANKAIIAHSRDEFILDFVSDLPPSGQIVARVITAPTHAKALMEALRENIERYEKSHGEIPRTRREPPRPIADA